MNTNYHQLQKQILSIADSIYRGQETISDHVKTAFQGVPRHLFIDRYRNYGETEWIHVTPENQEKHLPKLYADHPLVIFGTDSDFTSNTGTKPVSTISQPTFVLRMLDLLDIKKGHRIFEVGTGSGWNAALISKLTGDTGIPTNDTTLKLNVYPSDMYPKSMHASFILKRPESTFTWSTH